MQKNIKRFSFVMVIITVPIRDWIKTVSIESISRVTKCVRKYTD